MKNACVYWRDTVTCPENLFFLPPIKKDSHELRITNEGDVMVPVAFSPSEEFCHRQGEVTFLAESISQFPWWPAFAGWSEPPPNMGWWRNALPCLDQLSVPCSKVKIGQSRFGKYSEYNVMLFSANDRTRQDNKYSHFQIKVLRCLGFLRNASSVLGMHFRKTWFKRSKQKKMFP